ncbi:MAG: hypothetical protein KDB22_00595 [Planctomycetales bacterium]|nr:hypothetical protein [Planctomycetales bacterium]
MLDFTKQVSTAGEASAFCQSEAISIAAIACRWFTVATQFATGMSLVRILPVGDEYSRAMTTRRFAAPQFDWNV